MTTQTDPLAFFLTWTTYGTWLPGDARGWVEYHHGWQLPDAQRELEARARMTEDACWLSPSQRVAVEQQIAETCQARGWYLHAANCRSNHVHVVVVAVNTSPRKIRRDLKAWTTRRLRTQFDVERENWWAERGSVRHIYNEIGLETAIQYVLDGQDGVNKTEAPHKARSASDSIQERRQVGNSWEGSEPRSDNPAAPR